MQEFKGCEAKVNSYSFPILPHHLSWLVPTFLGTYQQPIPGQTSCLGEYTMILFITPLRAYYMEEALIQQIKFIVDYLIATLSMIKSIHINYTELAES